MIHLDCKNEVVELMHEYLDGDITKEDETKLGKHLEGCKACQQHFHELKNTITLIKSTVETKEVPPKFTENVMKNLPTEKKRVKYMRWFRAHPVLTAAAIFFIFLFSGILSTWHQDTRLVVSKQEDLIIKGDTVIVPEGVTVEGDLVVKNGNLKIDGTVDGKVTLIKGKLIQEDSNEALDGENLMASAGEVNGEFESVNKVFEWIWYSFKSLVEGIFSFDS